MITLDRVRKVRSGVTVLEDVSLRAEPRHVIGIMGRNGVGKTTLAHIAAGILRPDAGRIVIDGRDPWADYKTRRLVTFVGHQTLFDPMMTPMQALYFHARIYGVQRASDRIAEVLHVLDVPQPDQKMIFQLSAGTQKKIELAKAFICDSQVYIFDEPTTGLDTATKTVVWSHIRQLAARAAVILISHDSMEVRTLADQVFLLSGGKLQPIEEGFSLGTHHAGETTVRLEIANWNPVLKEELRGLSGVRSVTVHSQRQDPSELIRHLKEQGLVLPEGTPVQVITLDDDASEFLARLGLTPSQAAVIPAPPGPAELILTLANMAALSGVLTWANEKGLNIRRVLADQDAEVTSAPGDAPSASRGDLSE